MREYLIASRKHTQPCHRYITFWRSARAGYAWPLPWAGRYSADEAAQISDAPTDRYPEGHSYAVPADVLVPLMTKPRAGDIDGNTGPVLRNTKAHWAIIEAHAAILRTTEQRSPVESPTTIQEER